MAEDIKSFFHRDGYVSLSKPCPSRRSPRAWKHLRTAILTVIITGLLFSRIHSSRPGFSAPKHTSASLSSSSLSLEEPIPSIVHYVYVKTSNDSILSFHFAHFLSFYASIKHLQPSKIYIHTDYNATEIAHASTHGNLWTRKLLTEFTNLLVFNQTIVPEYAGPNSTQRIDVIRPRSEIAPWEQLVELGGIYIDWDVIPLRPLTPLLNSGFGFVVGRHSDDARAGGSINGMLNNGMFMTKPGGAVAKLMAQEQTEASDGLNFNLKLLNQITEQMEAVSKEVLILSRSAFQPAQWFYDDHKSLFRLHDNASPIPLQPLSNRPLDVYDAMQKNRLNRPEWHSWDFTSSYMLYAYGLSSNFQWVTPKKILSRRSNYGVATWDIVKHMWTEGYIDGGEDGDMDFVDWEWVEYKDDPPTEADIKERIRRLGM